MWLCFFRNNFLFGKFAGNITKNTSSDLLDRTITRIGDSIFTNPSIKPDLLDAVGEVGSGEKVGELPIKAKILLEFIEDLVR